MVSEMINVFVLCLHTGLFLIGNIIPYCYKSHQEMSHLLWTNEKLIPMCNTHCVYGDQHKYLGITISLNHQKLLPTSFYRQKLLPTSKNMKIWSLEIRSCYLTLNVKVSEIFLFQVITKILKEEQRDTFDQG